MNDERNTAELRVSETLLQTHTSDLADRGLVYEDSKTDHSALAGDSVVASFVHRTNAIRLTITVFPGLSIDDRGFLVIIRRANGDALNLIDFLRLRGKGNLIDGFVNGHPQPDIGAFVEGCLQTLLELLDTDLKPILEGRDWESTPVDWKGYK